MRRVLLALAVALGVLVAPAVPGTPAPTVEAAPSDIVAVVVDGTGNGHGRGLSQWGAYGWAVEHNRTWQQILDHYYGGTTNGAAGNPTMTVRLLGYDGVGTIDVVSRGDGVVWNGHKRAAMRVVWNGSGYDVYGSTTATCSVTQSAQTKLGTAASISMTTLNGSSGGLDPANTLGLCRGDGSVVHYRGSLQMLDSGGRRVVNHVPTEQYLRGVIPREVPASWGSSGGGKGMHALRAQTVAARSYALVQNRYGYAKSCDSSSCQVYGGAGTRPSATGTFEAREHSLTNQAIVDTAGVVRMRGGAIVSTEFSASNGPRTAGGTFPVRDDPADATPGNPLHRWTRVIDADVIAQRYGLGRLTSATMQDLASYGGHSFDGIWYDEVILNGSTRTERVQAWDFRNAFGLPSPGFRIRVITRDTLPKSVGFIGDSVGNGVAGSPLAEFSTLTDGMFRTAHFDMQDSRCTVNTACPGTSGVEAAAALPADLDLVIVQLGYNDWSPDMPAAIDAMMNALRARGAKQVMWVNLASATGISSNAGVYGARNTALQAATGRWPNLTILDWNSASNHSEKTRWFAGDGVHLTATGDAHFSLWLRQHLTGFRSPLAGGQTLSFRIAGVDGVPTNASAVALNVTAADTTGWGYLTVWPCGSPRPESSNVNFVSAGAVEPNSVLAKVDGTGRICVYTHATTHVLVDVAGWFSSGFESMTPVRTVDTRNAIGAPKAQVTPGTPLRVKVAGVAGVPANATAVAMNVTAVGTAGWGYLTVWPCGSPKPEASNVNFVSAGAVEPNSVLAKVDGTGEVCIATSSQTDVLVDVAGWFSSGFESMTPVRTVDTRNAIGAPKARVTPGAPLRVRAAGVAGVPANATAVAMNVTAVEPDGWGYLTVWPCGSRQPEASNVNFVSAGAVEPNSVLAKIDATGEVCIATSSPTDVLVDVAGWFSSGFESMTPRRTVDTRNGIGTL